MGLEDATAVSDSQEGGKIHAFFIGNAWKRIKLSFKVATAVSISLALGQNSKIAGVESTTMYVSSIFVVLFLPNKTRIQMIEMTIMSGLAMGAAVPFGMLAFLCSHATRSTAQDQIAYQSYVAALQRGDALGASPGVFYQGRPAAVSAVFLFILAWIVNVLKTLFVPQTFSFVAAGIVCGILLLEGYLFPTWALFYQITKQVLYCVYIGLACSFATNIFIFPYNAREPFLDLMGNYLDLCNKMIVEHANHFSNSHKALKVSSSSDNSLQDTGSDPSRRGASQDSAEEHKPSPNKPGKAAKSKKGRTETGSEELARLLAMRAEMTALCSALDLAKVPAKREFAYGHLRGYQLEKMYKLSRGLIIPMLGCNLWSQIADSIKNDKELRADEHEQSTGFLEALGMANELTETDGAEFFEFMETSVAPRIRALSSSCTLALRHIQRALHIGNFKRPPFYIRPFVKSPRAFNDEDLQFSDSFEADIAAFWAQKHIAHDKLYTEDGRPRPSLMLVLYMESAMHSTGLRLLEFCRWADSMQSSGTMRTARIIVPKPKRYINAAKSYAKLISQETKGRDEQVGKNLPVSMNSNGAMDTSPYMPDATEAFLTGSKPTLRPRTSMIARIVLPVYRLKVFIFDSSVSAFAFRAAIAMMTASLPAFFRDSVNPFLKYRLIWIPFTVLLGLMPVLGHGIAASLFRVVGTIVGGVIALVAVEIGRTPAGIIPVFFVFLFIEQYVMQLNPKTNLLPILLAQITGILVVGYKVMVDKLGISLVESSGQVYLNSPALMGYRILLTLAGVVVAAFYLVFPSLPTARDLLRNTISKHLFSSVDYFLLYSIRAARNDYDLPDGIDKAILRKQTESLALSANSHNLLGLTVFEPSPRGLFPFQDWTRVVTLLDNFHTSLAVANSLYTKLQDDLGDNISELEFISVKQTSEQYSRTVTACLYSLGNAFGTWQPLPPILDSPIEAHLAAQKSLHNVAHIVRDLRHRGILNADSLTHFGAYTITMAIMSRSLDQLNGHANLLIGKSGFKDYLEKHRKTRPTKTE